MVDFSAFMDGILRGLPLSLNIGLHVPEVLRQSGDVRGGIVHIFIQQEQLIRNTCALHQIQVRLHLPDNPGHILFPVDAPGVPAAAEVAGLAAGNAAHIIPVVGVAHSAAVNAVQDHALGKAHHAAGVGGNILVLGAQQGQSQAVAGGGKVGKLQLVLTYGDIHFAAAAAVPDEALAVTGDAAGKALALHGTGKTARDQAAVVIPHQAAHIVPPADTAGKGAVFNTAPAGAGNAAHIVPAVGGGQRALHGQVPDDGLCRDIAEKGLVGAVGGKGQAADLVAVPKEGSGKGGNRFDVFPAEVQVCFQTDRKALGPGIHGAVGGKALKVRPALNPDIRLCLLRSPGLRSRKDEGKQEAEERQQCPDPLPCENPLFP